MDLVAFEAGAKKNCPIYEFLGLSVLEAENGVFKATIPNSKEAGNHIGIMHAGVLFSLGEFLGGLSLRDISIIPVSSSPSFATSRSISKRRR